MANGFQRTVAGSGADDIAMVLRGGSQAEINSTVCARPGAADRGSARHRARRRRQAARLAGALSSSSTASSARAGTKANLPLRGIGPQGAALRKGVTHHRKAACSSRGTNEIVVGKGAVAASSPASSSAQTVTFGTSRWTVVGIFEAEAACSKSEIWADLPVVQSLFNRGNFVQTVRVRLDKPGEPRGAQELRRRTIRA